MQTFSYTTLDVVNSMLGLLGELPVNALDEDHQLIPAALSDLHQANADIQADQWWFNTERITLLPDVTTRRIPLPNDVAGVYSRTAWPRLAPRGRFLYNLDTNSDRFDRPVEATLHRIVPFEDCPIRARTVIAHRAQHSFVTQYDGDAAKIQETLRRAQVALAQLQSEHIRAVKANLFRRSGVQRIRHDIGRF